MSPLVAHIRFTQNAEPIARQIEILAEWDLGAFAQSPLDSVAVQQLQVAAQALVKAAEMIRDAKEMQRHYWASRTAQTMEEPPDR